MATRDGRSQSPRADRPVQRRDQRWALHAYSVVGPLDKAVRDDYEIVVNDLCTDILRNGLSVAIVGLKRQPRERGEIMLQHLASAGITGLQKITTREFPAKVCQLDLDTYMIATREILQLAAWLKRACQAHAEPSHA